MSAERQSKRGFYGGLRGVNSFPATTAERPLNSDFPPTSGSHDNVSPRAWPAGPWTWQQSSPVADDMQAVDALISAGCVPKR